MTENQSSPLMCAMPRYDHIPAIVEYRTSFR